MNVRKFFIASLIAAGFMMASAPEASADRRKVVTKHKRVHHRHRVGVRHIGRGTKVKTETKVETSR